MSPGFESVLEVVVVLAVIVIPALAVSARLALRPVVEILLKLHDVFTSNRSEVVSAGQDSRSISARLAAVEQELTSLRESNEFYRRLLESSTPDLERVEVRDGDVSGDA